MQLEAKVKEQTQELGNRDVTIRALQRNFESLSTMCQDDQSKLQAARAELASMKEKLEALEKEKASSNTAADAKLRQTREALDAMSAKFAEADEDRARERKKVAILQKKLDEAERTNERLEADLNSERNRMRKEDREKDGLLQELAQLRQQLESARGSASDAQQLQGNIAALQEQALPQLCLK